jgi:chaperone required for assembly of F1-ATPase
MKSAQDSMRAAVIRRFYKTVGIAESADGFVLTLDGRPARTPKKRPLAMPAQNLAASLAAEWDGQGEAIKPADMPFTRLANAAIDGVADTMDETRATLAAFAQSDLACFRAEAPDELIAAQALGYDPVLAFTEERLGARFLLGRGIMPVRQAPETLAKVREAFDAIASPFALTALHTLVSMTSSALLGLVLWNRAFDADHIWRLAHIDEDHQIALWGVDDEAAARRALHKRDFDVAAKVVAALAPGAKGN